MQGLYHSINYPADGCTKCEDMALPAAQLLFAMGNIADQWTDLVSENSLESQSATDQLNFLFQSFLILWEFGYNLDRIIRGASGTIQFRQILNFLDTSYAGVIRNNLQDHFLDVMGLYSSINFETVECRRLGTVVGALARNVLSLEYFD